MILGLVSIIIPVYNAEKYLDRCLNSALNQTYKNIEVIAINDGSTDNSLQILQSFSKFDARLKIIDKKNGGVSSARNVGLNAFTGEYVTFLDSDDYLADNYVYELYNKAKSIDAEIVRCNADNDGVLLEYIDKDFYIKVDDEYLYNEKTFSSYVHHALYKSSLIKGSVKFNEDFGLGEDCFFNAEVTMKAHSFYYIAKVLYHKTNAENSITNTADVKVYKTFIASKEALCEYIKKFTKGKAYRLVLDRYLFALYDVSKRLKNNKSNESKTYIKYIKKSIRNNYFSILSAGFGKKQKLQLLISGIF